MWKGILFAVIAIVVVAIAAGGVIQLLIARDTVTPVTTVNAGGQAGKALLVYQPGLSDFPQRITTAFREGLVESGWEVSTTTASAEAPAALADYDLVVLGSPVYSASPGKSVIRYIERVGDFGGKPVAIVLTGAGSVQKAIAVAEELVVAANGRPIRSVALMTLRPNDEENRYTGSNTDRAIQMAREAGQALRLPAL